MFKGSKFSSNKRIVTAVLAGIALSSILLVGNSSVLNTMGASKVGGNSPGGLNPYLGEFADYKEPEILSGNGALIVSLDNGSLGANFVDLNSNGQQTSKKDSYGGRLVASNDSSIAFVPKDLASNNIFTKYPYHYWASYKNSTYTTESLADTSRMIRETGSVTVTDPYWAYYWGGSDSASSVKSGLSTSDLLTKDSSGKYKFETIVDMGDAAAATKKNRQIWCNIANLATDGTSVSSYLNEKWFKFSASDLNNTTNMSMKNKQIQSIHYLDMLMSLYSAAKGTSVESEWRMAVLNYLNANGGKLGTNADNLTNIMLSRGVIWGTKATDGVSDDDFLTISNGADLVSFLYRIDRYNDIREPEVAKDFYKTVGSNTNNQLKSAYNGSRADAIADGVWYEEKYWKPLLSYCVTKNPKGAGFGDGDFQSIEAVSISTSKGAHAGLEVVDGLPLSSTVKNQEIGIKAFWKNENKASGDSHVKFTAVESYNRDSFVFGNSWEESDGNNMYNSYNELESSTMVSYTDALGNSKKSYREVINDKVRLAINGRLSSAIDVNNIVDNNTIFKLKFDITRTANAYTEAGSKTDLSFKNPSYLLSGRNLTSGETLNLSDLGWTNKGEDLRAFLNGTKILDTLYDTSTDNQYLKNGTYAVYSYTIKTTVYYGTKESDLASFVISGSSNDITVKRKDYINQKGGFQTVEFHSKPLAYSEIKEGTVQMDGTGSNETWEAMAGVPSTETLYYTAGGSEFITELHMTYVPKERAKRYYHTEFGGTDCEYKLGDQAGTYSNSGYTGGNSLGWIYAPNNSGGGGNKAIPTINKNFGGGDASVQSESYTFNVHTGGTMSVTIGGTIHNDAPATVEADGMGEATANNPHKSRQADLQSRVAAYQALTKWTQEVGATSIYYTASSDNVTRQIKLSGNGCSTSLPSMPTNEPADTSDYDGYNSHTEGDPGVEVPDPAHASAAKGADVTWSVTATIRIPAHVLCGPCCEHTLPAIQDNWTQVAEYSYMRVDSIKTWKIDRAYVDGMNEITYTKQGTVMADLVQGEPNIYYNIADENQDYYKESKHQLDYYASHGDLPSKNFVLHGARAGRIIYTLEPNQYDDVSWNEGTRSNRCNGDGGCYTRCSTNPSKVDAGSGRKNIKNTKPQNKDSSATNNCNNNDHAGQCWSIGCLYSNSNKETNDEIWWYNQAMNDKIQGATTNNKIDRYDMESPEVLRFKHRREQWNYIIINSDMVILQTTRGDYPLYYYQSLQWRNACQNYDYDKDAAVGKNLSDIGGTANNRSWHTVDLVTLFDGTDNSAFYGSSVYKGRGDQDDNGNAKALQRSFATGGGNNYQGVPYKQSIQGYYENTGREMQWHYYNVGTVLTDDANKEFGRDWLYRTFTDMWTDNIYCASQWSPMDTIPVSGYTGDYTDKDHKFTDSSKLTNHQSELAASRHQQFEPGEFRTFIEQVYDIPNTEWALDSSDGMLNYKSGSGAIIDNGYKTIILKMPDIDNLASSKEYVNSGQTRPYSIEHWVDPGKSKTGNGVVINPTDGQGSRFEGISGTGSATSVDGINYSSVAHKDGHYTSANYSGATYDNGKWSKDLTKQDGTAYENKTTAYRSSPFTTNSSSSALDGATDSVGSVHHQARIERPSKALRIAVDRVYPWAVQNGWSGDKQTYSHGIRQDATNENREYLTGNSYVFYRQILDYQRPAFESGRPSIYYDHANKKVSALGNKSGVLVEAPYSNNHFKINNIVVQDPVSVEDAYLISVSKDDGSALHGEDRDQRVSNTEISKKALERLNASKICPGTAALCEYRHLDCKYFSNVTLANLTIKKNGLYESINKNTYSYPSGFKASSDLSELTADGTGTRISIPLSDLGITYNSSLELQVEFEAKIPYNPTSNSMMMVSFNTYDLYNTTGGLCINTGHGNKEWYNSNNFRDNKWHKYKVIFNFSDAHESRIYVDGNELSLKSDKDSSTVNSSLIGSTFNIGCWNSNNNYKPNMSLRGNIKITKLSGSAKHNSSCYKTVTVHSETTQYLAKPKTFTYTGAVQYYTVPESGYYKLEAYGASGGDGYNDMDLYKASRGGLGGYASGVAYLTKGQKLGIYVGGQGKKATGYFNGGGWNGGGNGGTSGYGGGGASDIRASRVYTMNELYTTTDSRYVTGGKVVYGPYITLPSGTYKVELYGEGLNDPGIVFDTYWNGAVHHSYKVESGANSGMSGVSLSNSYSTYTVTIGENVVNNSNKGVEFRTFYNNSRFRIDRMVITCTSGTYSLQNRIIVAGGGGGADDTTGVSGGSNDGSGGYGGGLTGGQPLIDGAKQSGFAGTQSGGAALGNGGSATNQTDTGGGGGGYFGGKPTNHNNGGAGGGSSYVSGLKNSYTTYGALKGDGKVIITALDAEHAPESEKKVISSQNNTHVHTSACVTTSNGNVEGYKKNTALIGAFYQDFYGDSTALKAMLGSTVYNKYKSSNLNQTQKTGTQNFNYTGGRQQVSIPYAGEYTFEVYGASGGGNSAGHESAGGLGGKVTATKYLNPGDNIFVYVGGAGGSAASFNGTNKIYGPYMGGGHGGPGGFNGGGMSLVSTSSSESIKSWSYSYQTTESQPYQIMDPTAGTLIGSNDDVRSGNLNARLGVYLEAGKKYLICLGCYSSSCHGTYRWGLTGGNQYFERRDTVDEGAWSSKTFDPDCIEVFTPNTSGTYSVWANTGPGSDPCVYVTTYAESTRYKTVTVSKVDHGTEGTFTPAQALVVAGGGGGADNTSYSGTVQGGNDDGSGGAGGADSTLGNPLVNGARQSGYYASYKAGAGESAYANTDTGGGGAGYMGGKVTNDNNGGAGGGSNYVGNGATLISSETGVNSGNGKVIVSYKTSAQLDLIYKAITNVVAPNVSLIPETINGAANPVFICDGAYNKHVCNSLCKQTTVLKCSEPHHQSPMQHYPVTSDICYTACGYTNPNDPNNPHVHNADDLDKDSNRLGTMVNIDYGFSIYFPNNGDFLGENTFGLSSVVSYKGPSYKNDMDTTKWLREKRVRFGFDVLFHNPDTNKWEEYKANTWISLPILKNKPVFGTNFTEFTPVSWFKNNHYTQYDFYCLSSNVDIASSKVEYEAEAINAEGSSGKSVPYKRTITNRVETRNVDNTSTGSNSKRSSSFISKHSASKFGFVDVVGRIGNLLITDTEDLRFANFFKTPLTEGWIIDGVVRQVDWAKQNNILTWHTNSGGLWKDIRGVTVKDSTGMYNTWMTQDWLEDRPYMEKNGKEDTGSTVVDLPLTSSKNNIAQLTSDKLKPGYNILYEISTLGSYGEELQIIPYFYALNVKTDKLYPVDVYQKNEDGEYVPINFYDAVPRASDTETVKKKKQALLDKETAYPYLLNLEWEEEAERRNYMTKDSLLTKFLQESYMHYDETTGEHKPLFSPDNMTEYYEYASGKYPLGTLQYMNPKGFARTFVGSTYTQSEKFNSGGSDTTNIGTYGILNNGAGVHYTNLDNLIFRDRFWSNAQRWHLKIGTPSSTVFVKYFEDGKHLEPTELLTDSSGNPIFDKNGNRVHRYEELQNGDYAILITADIYAVGKTFTLKYDHELHNGRVTLGGKQYTFGKSYNGQEIKGNILAVYDADSTANTDIDIVGSH